MRTKIIIFFSTTLFVIFSVAGNAQSKFSYGLTGGAGYNFTKLEEASNLNFSLGLRGEFKISEKTDFRTGLSANKTGSRDATIWCWLCASCYCGIYTEYDFTFLSIPLNLKYHIINKEKSSYYISGGITPYYIYKDIVKKHFPGPEKGDRYVEVGKSVISAKTYDSPWGPVNANRYRLLNFNLNPGIEFRLCNHFIFQGEVQLKYSLMRVGSYYGIDNMFTSGIVFSILYNKNKAL